MPAKILKELPVRVNILVKTLSLLKGRLPRLEYNHIKRLMRDGTERDLIFMQGLTTGLQLAALEKKDIQTLLGIIKVAIKREEDGHDAGSLFSNSELEKIELLLRSKFNLNARKRIMKTISRGDGVLLTGLTEQLKKVYG